MHAEISNEKNGLMQKFFAILMVRGSFHRVEQNVVKEVIDLLLNLILTHNLLCESIVHAEYMIYNLYGGNGKAQNGLGKDLMRLSTMC